MSDENVTTPATIGVVFPLISILCAYLILKLYGAALIGESHLKVAGTFFKIRGIIPIRL